MCINVLGQNLISPVPSPGLRAYGVGYRQYSLRRSRRREARTGSILCRGARLAPARPVIIPGSPPTTASLPLESIRRLWPRGRLRFLYYRVGASLAPLPQSPTGSGPPSPGSAQWVLSIRNRIGAQSRRRSGVDEVLPPMLARIHLLSLSPLRCSTLGRVCRRVCVWQFRPGPDRSYLR